MIIKYDALTVVSPSLLGGETKNQDRAVFDSLFSVAAVCDGVSSSPYSAKAAELITQYAPILLDDPDKNLPIIINMLRFYRMTAINKGVKINSELSDGMRQMLMEASQTKLEKSCQSTFIGVKFGFERNHIRTRILNFGDSGFFAFSPTGQLLYSNLNKGNNRTSEVIAKPLAYISGMPELCEKIAKPLYWMICKVIESSSEETFTEGQLIVVPRCSLSVVRDGKNAGLVKIVRSTLVKTVSLFKSSFNAIKLVDSGNITAVLPDSFGNRNGLAIEERFPADTEFLLCSDGFYRGFYDSDRMWGWLKDNAVRLKVPSKRKELFEKLHAALDNRTGDDDISIVWIRRREQEEVI